MEKMQEHWIHKIQTILEEAREIPLFGQIPPFDWKRYSQALAKALSITDIIVESSAPNIIDYPSLSKALKECDSSHIINISPLKGQFVVMTKDKDRELLTSILLTSTDKGFSDVKFQKGFYQYILLQALHTFDGSKMYPDLHPQISLEELHNDTFYVFDLSIKVQQSTFNVKCALSSQLLASLKNHYSKNKRLLSSQPIAKNLDVQLKLQVARASLTLKQWNQIKPGDCVLLDQCSFDPETLKGSVTIILEETPIFRARLKKNSLKIQDYAFYYEEQQPMSEQSLSESQENPEENFNEPLDDTEEEIQDEQSHLWSQETPSNGSVEKLISSHEIPLTIVVEVDRIKINLEKLLQLSPGNVLDLSVHPEQGVYLTAGGKKIAEAEIVKLGETLGVKILKIAEQGK